MPPPLVRRPPIFDNSAPRISRASIQSHFWNFRNFSWCYAAVAMVFLPSAGSHPSLPPAGSIRQIAGERYAMAPKPQLRRVWFKGGLDTIAWKSLWGIAVSRNGRIAIASDVATGRKEGFVLQILSASSDTLISVARRGMGPGELSGDNIPFASGDTFHIVELRRKALVRYSDAGKCLGETPARSMSEIVLAFHGDSMDVQPLSIDPRLPARGLPNRRRIGDTTGRALLQASDSFLGRLVRERAAQPGVIPPPAFGVSATRVVVGDGRAYRIGVYDNRGKFLLFIGRKLPPNFRSRTEVATLRKSLEAILKDDRGTTDVPRKLRSRLDTLERETVSYFGPPGLRFDVAGRLWVLGEVGDSTFADAFAGSTFLGRQMLDCARPGKRIAMEGKWLVLSCENVAHDGAPFRVQLYAIDN